MRPFELAVASVLAAGPAAGFPIHGGPLQDTSLHVVVDSTLGLVVGVVLVGLYLAVLRRLDEREPDDTERRTDPPSSRRGSDNS